MRWLTCSHGPTWRATSTGIADLAPGEGSAQAEGGLAEYREGGRHLEPGGGAADACGGRRTGSGSGSGSWRPALIGDCLAHLHERGAQPGRARVPLPSGLARARAGHRTARRSPVDLAFTSLGVHARLRPPRCLRNDALGPSPRAALAARREAHLVQNEWVKGEWTHMASPAPCWPRSGRRSAIRGSARRSSRSSPAPTRPTLPTRPADLGEHEGLRLTFGRRASSLGSPCRITQGQCHMPIAITDDHQESRGQRPGAFLTSHKALQAARSAARVRRRAPSLRRTGARWRSWGGWASTCPRHTGARAPGCWSWWWCSTSWGARPHRGPSCLPCWRRP